MDKQIIKSEMMGEEYILLHHESGLKIFLYPMKGYRSTFAIFGTHYGSIDRTFKTSTDENTVTVPDGIAHFLEHKLFESEDGDAFTLFAKTGASANAYTSFDRTAYLFSCTERFEESLKALLSFVQAPYFTEETVRKEQGIIGQEIKMYQDDPNWKVFFNCLGALYHKHPVTVDITGTVESIAEIDKDLLYRCYRTFYNKNNMALCIAGNFDPDTAFRIIEENIKPDSQIIDIERADYSEPDNIRQKRAIEALSISMPQFCVGIKCNPIKSGIERLKAQVQDEILLELLAGKSSPLYKSLYEEGILKGEMGTEVFSGQGYFSLILNGDSPDPDLAYDRICGEIKRLQKEGLCPEAFETQKRALYGEKVRRFNQVENVANQLFAGFIEDYSIFDPVEQLAAVTLEQVENRLKSLSLDKTVLSVVTPIKEGQGEKE